MHGFDPQLLLSAEIGLSKVAYWLVKSEPPDGARAGSGGARQIGLGRTGFHDP